MCSAFYASKCMDHPTYNASVIYLTYSRNEKYLASARAACTYL